MGEVVKPGTVGLVPVFLSVNVDPAFDAVVVSLPMLVLMLPRLRCRWSWVCWLWVERARGIITNIWPMLIVWSYGLKEIECAGSAL